MRKLWGIVAAAALVWTAGPASAQRLEDPEANIVAELVVQAREPGPAWWKVSDEDSTVYILGVGEDRLPPGVTWDRRFVDRRLKGANSLIVGTRVGLRGGFGDIPALLRLRKQMRSKTPLEASLPEPLRARFVAQRTRIGQPASKYANWKPFLAGLQLLGDAQAGQKGAPVVFRGVRVGSVTDISVRYNARTDSFAIPVIAELDDDAVRLTPQYGAPSDPYPPPPPPPRDEPDAGKPRP